MTTVYGPDETMTEVSQVHAVASRVFNAPPAMLWIRIENRLESGTPDVAYTLLGVSGWVENKLFPKNGCPKHLTIDQITWGERWTAAGGIWHVMGKRQNTWLLYNSKGARALYEGRDEPVVCRAGSFPIAEMLAHLAPVGSRKW